MWLCLVIRTGHPLLPMERLPSVLQLQAHSLAAAAWGGVMQVLLCNYRRWFYPYSLKLQSQCFKKWDLHLLLFVPNSWCVLFRLTVLRAIALFGGGRGGEQNKTKTQPDFTCLQVLLLSRLYTNKFFCKTELWRKVAKIPWQFTVPWLWYKGSCCGWFCRSPVLSLWVSEGVTVKQKFDNSRMNVNSWVLDFAMCDSFFRGPTGQTAAAWRRWKACQSVLLMYTRICKLALLCSSRIPRL